MKLNARLLLPILIALAAAAVSAQPECPTIEVSGPAGITNPGEYFHFTATVDKAPSYAIAYRWTVSTGTIVEGQGTDKIKIDIDWDTAGGINLTATVEVLGLPKECPNTDFETAGVTICFAPVLEDEYSMPVSRIDSVRLAAFVVEKQVAKLVRVRIRILRSRHPEDCGR